MSMKWGDRHQVSAEDDRSNTARGSKVGRCVRNAIVVLLTTTLVLQVVAIPVQADEPDPETDATIYDDGVRPAGSEEFPFTTSGPVYEQEQVTRNFIPYANCSRTWHASFDLEQYGALNREGEREFIVEHVRQNAVGQEIRSFTTWTTNPDDLPFQLQRKGTTFYDPDRDYIAVPNDATHPETAVYPGQGCDSLGNLDEFHFWTTEPNPLVASISMPTPAQFVGDTASVVFEVTNDSDTPITELTFEYGEEPGLWWDDDVLELVDEPTRALPTELAPNETVTLTYGFRRIGPDEIEMSSDIEGIHLHRDIATEATLEAGGADDPLAGDFFRVDPVTDGEVKVGETAPVRLRVTNQSGKEITGLELVNAGITVMDGAIPRAELRPATEALDGQDEIRTLPSTLAATGPASVGFADFVLEGFIPGSAQVSAFLRATMDGDQISVQVDEDWEIVTPGLDVEVTPDLDRADGEPLQLDTDNDGDGDVDEDDHRFDVTVEITNETEDDVTDLHFLDEAEPVDWSNNLVGEDDGAPKLTLVGVRGEATEEGPGAIEELDVEIPDLAPTGEDGDSHTVTFVYEATGEVNATGQSVVLGAAGDATVRGSGTADVVLGSDVVVEFTTFLEDPDRLVTSGQVVRMGGYVENVDEDELDEAGNVVEEARPVVVWIHPFTQGNAGGGHLVERDGGRTPLGPEPIVVEPGERKELHGILVTTATGVRTDAEVSYRIKAWYVPDTPGEPATELNDDQIDIVEDGELGHGREHSQRLRFADLKEQSISACESHLYDAIVTCNFVEGVISLLSSLVDIGKMVGTGTVEYFKALENSKRWAGRQMMDVARALSNDPAAQQRLANELEVQLETLRALGIMTVDGGVSAVGILADFFAEADRIYSEGDVEAGLAWSAKFVGENPDLGFAALLKVRALAAMGHSALEAGSRSAAADIAREAVEAQTRATQRELQAKIDDAVARGVDPKQPKNNAIGSGIDVTDMPKVWRDVYGAAREDIANILRVAQEEGILVAFRSRNPRSIRMLEEGLAWLKPQSVKAKNVNAIDHVYLGFPADDVGKVVMMEPPVDWKLTGSDLDDAIDAHMDTLRTRHPELADPVWAGEVRDRLEMRVNKFNEHLTEWGEFTQTGMPVGFDYKANGVTTPADVKVNRPARVVISRVDNRYGSGTFQRYELQIAGDSPTDFRPMTGDIDIVGFFNPDRSPIMDPAKRERIYEKMRSLVGMQHGETLTWDHKKRAELLRKHIGDDAEVLLVAAPDRRMYTSLLDEKRSSAVAPNDNFADTFTLLHGPPAELVSPPRPPGPPPSGSLISLADRPTPKRPVHPYLIPGHFKRALEGALGDEQEIEVGSAPSADALSVVVRPDGTVEVYRLPENPVVPEVAPLSAAAGIAFTAAAPDEVGGSEPHVATLQDLIAAGAEPPQPRPTVGALGGRWEVIPLEEALAHGDPTRLELPPSTWTDMPMYAGDTTISVLEPSDLGVADGRWFQPGDLVVVDPGGPGEQLVRITAVEGHLLTLSAPVTEMIDSGVHVLYIPSDPDDPNEPADPGGPGGPTGPDEPGDPGESDNPLDRCAGAVTHAGFGDVTADSVHRRAIDCLALLGIVDGRSPRAYLPADPTSRGQLAAFLARLAAALGIQLPDGSDAFSDDDGSLHETVIDQLAAAGVLLGFGDGSVGPNRTVTRAQAAAMLARLWAVLGGGSLPQVEHGFVDAEGHVHEAAISMLASASIIRGDGDGRFLPHAPLRRDQMASLLVRLLEAFHNED